MILVFVQTRFSISKVNYYYFFIELNDTKRPSFTPVEM